MQSDTSTATQIASNIDVNVVGSLTTQLENYLESFIRSLPNIAAAIVVLVVTWLLAKGIKKLIEKAMSSAGVRKALIGLSRTVVGVAVWVLGILIAMAVLFPSVKPGSVLAALGVGGIAIGFAFKDIFENFMAGAMIMLRKPMRIGDFIHCEGVEGKIEEIMIRDTYVRQTDGQLVLVPNAMLFKNPVFVRTDEELRRFEIIAGVSYDADVDEAREIIRKAVEKLDIVVDNKPVDVFATEFNSSSIDFRVRWWSNSKPRHFHESRDLVIASIKRALDDAKIEIPYPYRTLTFAEPLKLSKESD
ncbi:MAG: mechanosensitive ion channel family protein [Woeseia sp.]|nr:mechanosensitive ion channel family protein [Woeseia sp.]MBT8095640.1 mechanosensitive ion channel family protein [Woeseia sp.]NNE61524.1 mechanosensitive ion channel family protein [Woeseia sp.]NNL54120.1 mechanosensitive ion channel family protein [Woeseia sp.]